MIAHTKGPWMVAYLDPNGQRIVRNEFIEICTCWHHSIGLIERAMEANARLIAAAPDLLAALLAVIDHGTTYKDSTVPDLIRAAIAKATGGQS